MDYYARFDKDKHGQLLKDHLLNVAQMLSQELSLIGFKETGFLIGLLHDLGKYQKSFQDYLLSECGIVHSSDTFVKVPHACFGALYWQGIQKQAAKDFVMLSIASHHTGLYDLLNSEGERTFYQKLDGWRSSQNYDAFARELETIDDVIIQECLKKACLSDSYNAEMSAFILKMKQSHYILDAKNGKEKNCSQFMTFSFLQRLFYSALIHSDRTDAAGLNLENVEIDWNTLYIQLESYMTQFKMDDISPIHHVRKEISTQCANASFREQGIYRLTLPTGAGKTLSALRYAVGHASKYNLKHIFYFAPFTSILEQNAQSIRNALNVVQGDIVFEHHSNVIPEQDFSNTYKVIAESWNAQIICSTMVQFLNALFSCESRSARRMIALQKSVIIIDEIQSVPLNLLHLLAHALNFLREFMGCTIVLCSATQPLLDRMPKEFGRLIMNDPPELVPNYGCYFEKLKRVNIHYESKLLLSTPGDWAKYTKKKAREHGAILVVVSTKKFARDVYLNLDHKAFDCYYLSTRMCPHHRLTSFSQIRKKLENSSKPLIVISTPLIEAGVDISFRCVIRMTAGLDAIAQAAGRCNRHGESNELAPVYVLDPPKDLKLPSSMQSLWKAGSYALQLFTQNPEKYGNDLLNHELLEIYYQKAYFDNAEEMKYKLSNGRTVLDLLSINKYGSQAYSHNTRLLPPNLAIAYREAGECFKSIDTFNDIGILVPYTDAGKSLICKIQCAKFEEIPTLLQKIQPFCVNISEQEKDQLMRLGALSYASREFNIVCLNEQYYNMDLGLTTNDAYLEPMSTLSI